MHELLETAWRLAADLPYGDRVGMIVGALIIASLCPFGAHVDFDGPLF